MANNSLHGSLAVPGDKSITHRALIFSALCKGKVTITGISPAADCESTANCMKALGLEINRNTNPARFDVESPGLNNLLAPHTVLDAGNSGTTMRVMSGLVAGRSFTSKFDGDDSLRKRPMSRVLDHLCEMGAEIVYADNTKRGCAPFLVHGTNLKGKDFNLKVASAQVQTALLLAGLQAEGKTTVTLPQIARDHTLRMFKYLGVPFTQPAKNSLAVEKLQNDLPGKEIKVPADISSAAFFMVGAAVLPGSDLLLTNCGINPGRTLIVDILKRMGADINYEREQIVCGEPVADIRVRYSGRLKGCTISGEEIASGIDEIPIIAIAGALCDGQLKVEGAEELRHKESDRLQAIVTNLRTVGADVVDKEDGFIITGRESLTGGRWETYSDHRLAMTGLIASIICKSPLEIAETESIRISYPTFREDLQTLVK